jgi:hypothetical protein
MLFSMRTVMWVAIVGVLLTWGYWLAKPISQAQPSTQVQGQGVILSAPLKQFSVEVGATDAKSAQPVFRVTENDEVAIRVTSDQAGTLTLHGYTDGVAVTKKGVATVRIKATHTGRFPLHLHGEGGSHLEIATIEILPK